MGLTRGREGRRGLCGDAEHGSAVTGSEQGVGHADAERTYLGPKATLTIPIAGSRRLE